MNTTFKTIYAIIIFGLSSHSLHAQFDCLYNDTLNGVPLSPTNFYDLFETENKISSSGEVHSIQTIEFSAGKSICLEPGFLVEPGATFLADIDGCVNSCPDVNPCPEVVCFKTYPPTLKTDDGNFYYPHEKSVFITKVTFPAIKHYQILLKIQLL